MISEFGRTFKEKSDKGTDHGHGSVYWVLGGAVKGGRLAGEQVAFAPKSLNESGGLPVLTDNRAMISSIMQRLYGMRPDQIEKIYPGEPEPLGSLSLI